MSPKSRVGNSYATRPEAGAGGPGSPASTPGVSQRSQGGYDRSGGAGRSRSQPSKPLLTCHPNWTDFCRPSGAGRSLSQPSKPLLTCHPNWMDFCRPSAS